MIYTQKIFLNKFCKKIREEPFVWKDLFKKIKFQLPDNKIIDLKSLDIGIVA